MKQKDNVKVFYNPAGFIEMHMIGAQTPESSLFAVDELLKMAKKLNTEKKPVLMLIDLTKLTKVDVSSKLVASRAAAIKAMMNTKYKKVAVFGNTPARTLVSAMALVAGKREKIKTFTDRDSAVIWLKKGMGKNGK